MPSALFVEVELCLPTLPTSLAGLRILHLSDLHARGIMDREQRLLELAAEGCDLCCVTGDLCAESCPPHPLDRRRTLSPTPPLADLDITDTKSRFIPQAVDLCRRLAEKLVSPLPAYLARGNHDPDAFMEHLPGERFDYVANDTRLISLPGREAFNLLALDCYSRQRADVCRALLGHDPGLFTIALTHMPEYAPALALAGAQLILAGHTHGGQMCLPGGRALILHSYTRHDYSAGRAFIGETAIYTSRGLRESLLPIRVSCPAEVTRLKLRCGASLHSTIRTSPL